jgi:AAA15 family ATPase/GTPase
MLARFTVENFLSFADEVSLNLIATESDNHNDHVVSIKKGKPISLLKIAALYGANASGKSNLVQAIDFAKDLIVKGTKSGQAIHQVPFRLDKTWSRKPSHFEFTINFNGITYIYGFKLTSSQILEEWLFAVTNKAAKEIRYFERTTTQGGKTQIELGPVLSGRSRKYEQFLSFVAEGTRANQLFLTEAINRNVKKLVPLMKWFQDVLQIISAESVFTHLELKAHKDKSFTNFLGAFLKAAGTGIDGVETKPIPIDFDNMEGLPEDEREEVRTNVLKGSDYVVTIENKQFGVTLGTKSQPILVELKTKHHGPKGQKIVFDVEDESDGTQRLIHLVPVLANSRATEKVYVIDELDRRLHPLLSKMFLSAYIEGNTKTRGQLIFTTHDTNLLDLELMRNDEVWFIEKDKGGASHLYSLAEFRIHPSLTLQKGYLNGRFGAIPFIGDLTNLGSSSNSPSD